jgi:hypothetical protein
MIIPELLVFFTPKVQNKSFLHEGKLWSTSRVEIAQGVCARSSMIIVLGGPHVWVIGSLLKHTIRDVGHCLTHCLLNLKRSQWIGGFLALLNRFWCIVVTRPG